ncbi:uncharacterized protein BDZ83DRAFT_376320 [Colletotrichum acutatum]|uniref:Uncharacterized protein n=1 Tax=Glomerella acutata TaxID=27357 RepID=A0AAD8XNL3_GLOAC|nr:uncharacterized protein BDZ83DRAFT_376320 [Colletotrichum acutatum]KAK1730602.1 hypothetical protein BDZ83DRAFT_376320 [Colletotrichum acutatum]
MQLQAAHAHTHTFAHIRIHACRSRIRSSRELARRGGGGARGEGKEEGKGTSLRPWTLVEALQVPGNGKTDERTSAKASINQDTYTRNLGRLSTRLGLPSTGRGSWRNKHTLLRPYPRKVRTAHVGRVWSRLQGPKVHDPRYLTFSVPLGPFLEITSQSAIPLGNLGQPLGTTNDHDNDETAGNFFDLPRDSLGMCFHVSKRGSLD